MKYPPLIDAHVHFWDLGRLHYPWLKDIPALNQSFLPEDYRQACGDIPVQKLVFVEAECDVAQSLDEVRWIGELAKQDPRISGMVAHCPVEKGAGAREHMSTLSQHSLVKGVRRILQAEFGPPFCLRPDFIAGVRMLAEFDLTFDLCITHDQLPGVIELARGCPEVRFMLDHMGKPPIKDGWIEPWRQHLQELAACPNVWCKISGLVTEADHRHWRLEQLAPYLQTVFDGFGFDRLVFGSDWPVMTLATPFPRWVDSLLRWPKGFTEDQLGKLFFANAEIFYRI